MPTRLPPSTRARDKDRTDTCATLDEALADGQLSNGEHAARIDLAMEAGTLSDLHALIEDLQNESALAPMSESIELAHPLSTARSSKLGFFAVTVPLVAALIALTFGIRSCSADDDDPVSRYGESGYLNPAALSEIFDAFRAQTGSSMVDRVVVYPNNVSVDVPAAGAPQKQISFDYRDGEFAERDWSTSRTAGIVQVDLGAIDLQKVGGIVAGAPTSLNVDPVETLYLSIDADENGTSISMYASNDDQESGYLTFDADGEFLSASPFSFEE
ncbi:DUF1707 SHOCT-like domain-containing protein [Rhodococcoides yunnanense]|uniref:DUF1707 SHOCT-like domain-containing protein n=1 Tax=Rhodococcoides yunnanense TaxID=278209 RepID=UPI000935123B|nr:DUF1707 domain-containing protein [Rhodococcus yunnanensis]